ncbi:TetR family transcriptional regulator [Actinophytocola sp. S1-96]|uniref:TetR family transcriptional regulator n=2 Tax=Actinophytocola gossypii TaxID=2812003 RepID=A0ABT2J1S5_9PSEU|nr:TetR family transcriptional regulator [Actinophytocola gossypii]
MASTATRLATLARQLTVEHGLSGFTVDEVCERAGVSRRTFFNYFASKDDAVLGLSARGDTAAKEERETRFLAGGDPTSDRTSARLLDDLAELAIDRWTSAEVTVEHVREVQAVVEREPRLLTRCIERVLADERVDIELVERREGLPAGDLRAATAVSIMNALAGATFREFLAPANTDSLADILARRLAAARALLSHDLERTS